jgi:hypothetical protein
MTTARRNPASPFPGSIEIDGVILYEAEDEPHTWLYIPGKPMPEMSGRGRPTLHLYVCPSGGSSNWAPSGRCRTPGWITCGARSRNARGKRRPRSGCKQHSPW